jgi:hypothetical protein
MVTEGFGRIPMCSRAFELLASYDGWEASLDGRTWLHGREMRRPELIIPLPRANPDEIPSDEAEERLALGQQVRILSTDELGQVGTVVAFPRGMRPLACGVRHQVAEVHLEDGRLLGVPLENLEVLGQGKLGKPSL